METEIVKVSKNGDMPGDAEKIKKAAQIIKRGGTVCFPTETVYGLGAKATSAEAARKIFEAKGRPQDNPLIIHISSLDDIDKYCHASENKHFPKISHLMPGPLTLILPRKEMIPLEVTGGLETVAVRFPVNPIARALISESSLPIAAPSANLSGRPSPTRASHVIEDLFGKVDMIIDAGECDVGLESTIVSLAADTPILLRPGAVTYEQLCDIFGRVDVSSAILSEMRPDEKAAAPGMKYRHYAPDAPTYLVSGDDEKVTAFLLEKQKNSNCAVICFDEDARKLSQERLLTIGKRNDPEAWAHEIFDALRKTNEYDPLDAVYVHIEDDRSGIRLAVYNRLLKASGFHHIKI